MNKRVDSYVDSSVSEEDTVSIIRAEDGDRMFLQNEIYPLRPHSHQNFGSHKCYNTQS